MPGPQPPFSIRYTFTPECSIASDIRVNAASLSASNGSPRVVGIRATRVAVPERSVRPGEPAARRTTPRRRLVDVPGEPQVLGHRQYLKLQVRDVVEQPLARVHGRITLVRERIDVVPARHDERADAGQLDRADRRESDDRGHDRGHAAKRPPAPAAAQRSSGGGERTPGVGTGIRVARGAGPQPGDDIVIV